MARYDIFCEKCEKKLEQDWPIKDLSKITCPVCFSPVVIEITPKRVIYNADGFHKTDYVKDGPKDRTPKSYYEEKAKLKAMGKFENIEKVLNGE